MDHVHEISVWSGKPEDETPLCGVDRHANGVADRRTVYTSAVTCPDCRRIRSEWEAYQDLAAEVESR